MAELGISRTEYSVSILRELIVSQENRLFERHSSALFSTAGFGISHVEPSHFATIRLIP
jgi:hypothetical protein